MCDAISNIIWWVNVLGLVFAYGLLINDGLATNQKVAEILIACAYAWDTGGQWHIACNVAIFLRKLVTCTTMWAYPLGNPI